MQAVGRSLGMLNGTELIQLPVAQVFIKNILAPLAPLRGRAVLNAVPVTP